MSFVCGTLLGAQENLTETQIREIAGPLFQHPTDHVNTGDHKLGLTSTHPRTPKLPPSNPMLFSSETPKKGLRRYTNKHKKRFKPLKLKKNGSRDSKSPPTSFAFSPKAVVEGLRALPVAQLPALLAAPQREEALLGFGPETDASPKKDQGAVGKATS